MTKHELVHPQGSSLVPGDSAAAQEILADKVASAHRTRLTNDKAPRTLESYGKHLKVWNQWCAGVGLQPFPATVPMVLAYLNDLEPALALSRGDEGRISIATMKARLAAVAFYQDLLNDPIGAPAVTRSAEVRGLVRALTRKYNVPQNRKRPIVRKLLRQMVKSLPDTLAGHRDRALLLLGMLGAFRRSEISALTIDNIRAVDEGLEITLWKSKTDQSGEGQMVGIAANHTELCPADALVLWLDASRITSGHIFWPINQHGQIVRKRGPLTGHGIATIVKRHAKRVGLDPAEFSGHSLRAGFATSASAEGATLVDIAEHTRHRNLETLRRYIRHGTLFSKRNPTRVLGDGEDE